MATGKGIGPGGRVARAEKKVDKAKGKVSKLVGKYGIASTDGPDVYFKKKEMQAKTAPKIAKAVDKVNKAKDKLINASRKAVEKATPVNSGVEKSPVREGLSALDKFDKRIKVRKLEKEAKPAARAYNARLRAKK
jgi:Tfp pilus assembly major pilin PilA